MKKLIIVESPTKAKTLMRFLGDDYAVEATMGHIKDLPKSKLSVDVENNFKPDYQVVEKRSKEIGKIISEAKRATSVYIATDPDREGEAIAQHVVDVICSDAKSKNNKVKLKRIVFHEITKSAVENAILNPTKVNVDLVDAQIARRVLDRLVGYKLSPLLWKKVRRGLSAGRVQTVAVRLIVEREREIEAFKKREYWEIFCRLKRSSKKTNNSGELNVKLLRIGNKKAEINNAKSAKSVTTDLNKSDYNVVDIVKREVKKNPYPPFTTSTLTQSAANLFGWGAKRTMSVAQKLYELGLITYHRTDSVNISKEALGSVRKYITKEIGGEYLPKSPVVYKTKSRSAQEAHEAIRPTNVNTKYKKEKTKFSEGNEKLYDLIWARFVASQMNPAIYDSTRIDVLAQCDSGVEYLLRATGIVMKFDGWRKIVKAKSSELAELPNLEEHENLNLVKVISEQKFTKPPARFSEASLIKILESLGIGRPSTYAPTISTIQLRNYVEKNEGRFKPTAIGIAVNDFLIPNFKGVFNYSFTALMEENLDRIAEGKIDWQKKIGDFYHPFEKKLLKVEAKAKRVKIAVETLGRKCPTCKTEKRVGKDQGELIIRTGRFGKFISCDKFPECKHTEKYDQKIDMKCLDCKKGDVVVKMTKRKRKFYGCSRYPKCEWASWKKPKAEKKETKDEKVEN